MITNFIPDIAKIEVEAIEKVVSLPQEKPAAPALTMGPLADSVPPPMTRIGIDAATGADVMVGDRERCGGFYILGQPRTGKSNLLISTALLDIEKGTSILFIDPHTDAITDLLSRIPQERRKHVILLDPTQKSRSFGINLLHCADRTDPLALDATWGRMRDVFVKVWGDEKGQLGFWFDKILRNSVYLLLENPGYTLVEVPLLLREDTTFRNSLIENVRVKSSVKDFWFDEFDRLSRRDRTEQVGPALNRLSVFRDIHIIRDIVGQTRSNLDFRELLQGNTQKIILLRMPTNLASDVKHLIGTMLLSEIVHAAFERAEVPEKDRPYFGIYCDEFQEFATPDFARLFTQTGKFKVMPTVAHQTRFGQFRTEDPNWGATLASANKVFFALSSADAKEVPLEFAQSPAETGVVSQYPVRDLLEGHHHPKIREFVNKYLRHLQERREDTREEMEGERLLRLGDLDDAALYGVDERVAGLLGPSYYSSQMRALEKRQQALLDAQRRTGRLLDLHETSRRLRVTIRGLDDFLIKIMEGAVVRGTEAFSDFLIKLTSSVSAVPEAQGAVLDLYIALSYGDPGAPRTIPFDLARSQGLFSHEVAALTFQAEKRTEEERRAFQTRFIADEEQNRARSRMMERESKPWDRLRAMEGRIVLMNRRCSEIGGGRTGTRGYNMLREEDLIWHPANVYTWFMWLKSFPHIEKLVIPYQTAKFTETWKYLMADGQAATTITKLDESLKLVKYPGYGCRAYMPYMVARVARDLKEFLNRYQEGALVVLALLDCAGKGGWRAMNRSDDISLSEFPGIQGQDPVEVWCLLERIRVLMREALGERNFSSLFIKYLDRYFEHSYDGLDEKLDYAGFQTSVFRYPIYDDIRYRKDVQALEALLSERWSWFVRQHSVAAEWWKKSSAPVRYYLLCRAADRVSFAERYSSLPQAAFAPYEEVVGALVSLSKDTQARLDEAEEKEEAAKEKQRIEKECAQKVGKISYSPPAILESRVLTGSEIQEIKRACVKELSQDHTTRRVAATIDEFAVFCELLAQPENHIKGRYANTRTEADMVNEMARVLTDLQDYTAYAKVRRAQAGESIVWKGKVRTIKLAKAPGEALEEAYAVVEQNASDYCRPREEIGKEIAKRQEQWRARVRVEAPSVRIAEAQKPGGGPERPVSEPEEPMPPTHYRSG